MKSIYDFGVANEPEWFVDEIISHRWVTTIKILHRMSHTLLFQSKGYPIHLYTIPTLVHVDSNTNPIGGELRPCICMDHMIPRGNT